MISPLMQTSSNKLQCCVCVDPKSKSVPWKIIDSFQLMKCCTCGLIHLNKYEVDPEKFLDDVSANNDGNLEYWGYPSFFKKYSEVFEYFFQERYSRIQQATPPSGVWFDIGSGYGFWQKYLEGIKIPTYGIEIDPKAYKFCEQQNLKTQKINFEKFNTSEKYAVITMCDVLEHVHDPTSFLQKCKTLLLPDGLLYIQVPCVIGARYPLNHSLGLPHHLWQFNPKTLCKLVENCGFKTIKTWTGIQGVIKHYENGGPTWWTSLFWKLAVITRRGNRLQLLVRKK